MKLRKFLALWRADVKVDKESCQNDVSFSGMEVGMYFTRLKHENVDYLCVL